MDSSTAQAGGSLSSVGRRTLEGQKSPFSTGPRSRERRATGPALHPCCDPGYSEVEALHLRRCASRELPPRSRGRCSACLRSNSFGGRYPIDECRRWELYEPSMNSNSSIWASRSLGHWMPPHLVAEVSLISTQVVHITLTGHTAQHEQGRYQGTHAQQSLHVRRSFTWWDA